MTIKFQKNRSVSRGYILIPLYYTGIIHPNNSKKELVLMEKLGKSYSACWRNNYSCKIGISFLLKATTDGFIFKDKEYLLKNINRVL